MRIQGHIAGSILICSVVLTVIRPPIEVADRLLVFAAISGTIPDWDTLFYFVKKRSFTYGKDFRHHTWITHTFFFYAIPSLLIYMWGRYLSLPEIQWYAIVFGLSTSTHLIQDMFGSGDGIMVFYPFNREMKGLDLSRKHGNEWLKHYVHSRAYRVELLIIAAAIVYILFYIGYRIYPLIDINFIIILRWAYLFILTVFMVFGLIILMFLLLQIIINKKIDVKFHTKSPMFELKHLLKTDLSFNVGFAFLSVPVLLIMLAKLPLSSSLKLWLLPIIICVVPYLWGWRTTTLGLVAGTGGIAIGLLLFSFFDTQIVWREKAPYWLFLNLVGQISGYLGGFVGNGQIRESMCISYMEINLGKSSIALHKLIGNIKTVMLHMFELKYLFSWDSVPGNDNDRFLRFLKDYIDIDPFRNVKILKTEDCKTIRVFTLEKSIEIVMDENKEKALLKINDGRTYNLQVKEDNDRLNIYELKCSNISKHSKSDKVLVLSKSEEIDSPEDLIVTAKTEMIWRYRYSPQLQVLQWLIKHKKHSLSEVIDCMLNIWRHVIASVVLTHPSHGNVNSREILRLTLMTYRETPSIVWVDSKIVDLAKQLHVNLLKQLNSSNQLEVLHDEFLIFRLWKEKPKIEQYAKKTWGAEKAGNEALDNFYLDSGLQIPKSVVSEFTSSKTFFDPWRGRTSTFLIFLGGQFGIGIFINVISSLLI